MALLSGEGAPFFKLTFGLAALGVAWILFYRSRLIFQINAWMRERIFNDQLVLFSGRRLAMLLLVLGAISFFSGVESVIEIQPMTPEVTARIMEQARIDMRAGRHTRVINRCREVLRADPKNIAAWELVTGAWWAIGDKARAKQGVDTIMSIDPFYPIASGPLAKIIQNISEVSPPSETPKPAPGGKAPAGKRPSGERNPG